VRVSKHKRLISNAKYLLSGNAAPGAVDGFQSGNQVPHSAAWSGSGQGLLLGYTPPFKAFAATAASLGQADLRGSVSSSWFQFFRPHIG
jgi:hypothetical protein